MELFERMLGGLAEAAATETFADVRVVRASLRDVSRRSLPGASITK
jgi:hypothetical protein